MSYFLCGAYPKTNDLTLTSVKVIVDASNVLAVVVAVVVVIIVEYVQVMHRLQRFNHLWL